MIRISPTDTVPTVTSNTPVTGVPSDVSGILTLGEVVGVGVGVGVGLGDTLAFALGLGLAAMLGDGEGAFDAEADGDGLAAGDELGIGEAILPPGA